MILTPLSGMLSIIELTKDEVRKMTDRHLITSEQRTLDVLQYGRVVSTAPDVTKAKPADIILYEKLACHVTNFGTPRQSLIHHDHVHATLTEEAN